MVADCRKRPGLAKHRTVKVEIKIKPHPQDPDDVVIEPVTTSRTPAKALDPIRGRCTRRNQLQFEFDDAEL